MPTTKVLDEGMADNDHAGAAVLLEATHRSQPCFQPAVVSLNAIVGVLPGAMPGGWDHLVEHDRVSRRLGR